jgi:hypothetical protein
LSWFVGGVDVVMSNDESFVARMGSIYGQVELVLSKNRLARNNDSFLIDKVLELRGVDFPCSHESITRARRDVQNRDGLWLPTDPMVIIQRRIAEDNYRRYYSNDVEMLGFIDRIVQEKRYGIK